MKVSSHQTFPVAATFFCVGVMLCLFFLGLWQVHRLEWKNNLQAQLNEVLSQSSQELSFLSEKDIASLDRAEMMRGKIEGRFIFSKALYMNGFIENGRSAFPVVVPVQMGHSYVAAVLWIEDHKNLEQWQNIADETRIMNGLVRYPEQSVFLPKNNPVAGEWWRFDVQDISNFWSVSPILPAVFYAEDANPFFENSKPYPVTTTLRNEHLSYAIFWFVMAVVLLFLWGMRFWRPYLLAQKTKD